MNFFEMMYLNDFVMNEPDRRTMERFDLKLLTKLLWTGKNNKQGSIELMTHNICAGGAYLMTNRPLPQGTAVKMDLMVQLGKPHESGRRLSIIIVSGHVIRTDDHGMAICFDRNYKILPH